MAEPYDTVNGITAGAPKHWFRFSDASGGVTQEGVDTRNSDLSEVGGGSLGTFNWTYQYEVNPAGDGYGMLANGGGALTASAGGSFDGGEGQESEGLDFTMMAMYRTTTASAHANAQWFGGYFLGSDTHYCRMAVTDFGIYYMVQDGSADDKHWRQAAMPAGIDLFDMQVHTLCVTNPTGTSGTLPIIYVDGLALKDVVLDFTSGSVNDNHAPTGAQAVPGSGGFIGDLSVGYRGGNNTSPLAEIVYYEWMGFDHRLSAEEVHDVHIALGGTPASRFADKSVRRGSSRRAFFDYSA